MKKLLQLLLFTAPWMLSTSQDTTRLHRKYSTQEFMKTMLQNDSVFLENRSEIERFTADYMIQGIPDTVGIPVVFHFIGDGGAVINSADIDKQMESLNRDFFLAEYTPEDSMNGAWIAEFWDNAASPRIQFCLATEDPWGNPTNGLIYVPSDTTVWSIGTNIMDGARGGSNAWQPSKYLNIWVALLIDDKAGYAQMPGGPGASDGVVLNSKYFQRDSIPPVPVFPYSRYLKGRTLTHLIAAYLNLYELWDENILCGDDYLDDTPVHNAPNYAESGYPHVSTCGENPIEMTINLMDNVDDEYQFMFTHGQVMRMHAILTTEGGYRSGLITQEIGCNYSDTTELLEVETRSIEKDTIAQREGHMQIRLFPNPASIAITIQIISVCHEDVSVDIFNSLGELQYTESMKIQNSTVNALTINTKEWISGSYTVRAICGSDVVITKFLLQH